MSRKDIKERPTPPKMIVYEVGKTKSVSTAGRVNVRRLRRSSIERDRSVRRPTGRISRCPAGLEEVACTEEDR